MPDEKAKQGSWATTQDKEAGQGSRKKKQGNYLQ